MKEISSKKQLAIALSHVKGFDQAKVSSEQYLTDSNIAADILWNCHILGDFSKVSGKVLDLGAGTGILGIGARLLSAVSVEFIENDSKAIDVLKANLGTMGIVSLVDVRLCDLSSISSSDYNRKNLIIMNPPFGTKKKHADKEFLEKAFEIGDVVYSIHKSNTKGFVEAFARDSGFVITHSWEYQFPLLRSMEHHTKVKEFVDVTCFRFEKNY
tara:strand:- start:1102 stop:1740 length:639 start_codon:yes stop_codon:yes gene_type:complete